MMANKSKAIKNKAQNNEEKGQLDLKTTIYTIFTALIVSFILCILAGILFGWTMYETWIPLLPGFVWPVTLGGFLSGLIWIIGYSFCFGALIVLPYNYFLGKRKP